MNPKPLSIDDIAPPSHANPSDISQSQDTSKNKIIVSNKRKHSKESTRNVVLKRSPAIYGEAMTAMIELGDIDQMLFLLCRDLTSKGYLPAKGLLVPALNALVKHGNVVFIS